MVVESEKPTVPLMLPTLGKTYSVNDAIEHIGFGRAHVLITAVLGSAYMADAMEVMLLSLLPPYLVCEWGITPMQQAICTTSVFVGWLVGGQPWGLFADRYGRRRTLEIVTFFGSILGMASSLSPNYQIFALFRFLVGCMLGGVVQALPLCAEFVPSQQRAKCVTAVSACWLPGVLIEVLLGMFVFPRFGWRWMVFCSSVPLMLVAICARLLVPESPRFLVAHGKAERARVVLHTVAKMNREELPAGELEVCMDVKKPTIGGFTEVFKPPYLRATLLFGFIWASFSGVAYGLALLFTQISVSDEACVADIRMSHKETVCHEIPTESFIHMALTSLSELPAVLLSTFLVETIGRKKTMFLAAVMNGSLIFLQFICFSRLGVVILFFIARGAIAMGFQALNLFMPESFPTELRSRALGACTAFSRLGSILSPFIAQVLGQYNMAIALAVYGSVSACAASAIIFLPKETKDAAIR